MFELIWIKASIDGDDFFIYNIYHPPKPSYSNDDIISYLTSSIYTIMSTYKSPIIVVMGDLNQLPNAMMLSLGLISIVNLPTRLNNCLDRIYCTHPIYINVNILTPAVSSDHKLVIASSSRSHIVDTHKCSRKVKLVRRTALQDYSVLRFLQSYDWSNLYSTTEVQASFDIFYTTLEAVLTEHYPPRSVTLTSRDPPFMTPVVKSLVRQRNQLLRRGHVEKALAISIRVGREIQQLNSGRLAGVSAEMRDDGKEM